MQHISLNVLADVECSLLSSKSVYSSRRSPAVVKKHAAFIATTRNVNMESRDTNETWVIFRQNARRHIQEDHSSFLGVQRIRI